MDAPDSVLVAWFTPDPAIGQVELLDPANAGAVISSFSEDQPTDHHAVRVSGLEPGQDYAYRLIGAAATDSDVHRLRAPRRPGQRMVFALVGDSGSGQTSEYGVVGQIKAADPDYILHAGDVAYPEGADEDYVRTVFDPFASVWSSAPIFPTVGNHDVGTLDGAAYLKNFILPRNGPAGLEPERCYSIDLGNVHLVSLDLTRNLNTISNVIVPWLRGDLAASHAQWKFVLFRFPVYTSGTPTRPIGELDIALWSGLFDAAHVDLCLNGHNHYYERSKPIFGGELAPPGQGTVYVVSGNGGQSLYTLADRAPFSAAGNDHVFGFTRITVEGGQIDLTHIDQSGNVIDQVAWSKEQH